ncbi:hypothetical protein ACOME3_000086 [Neoechinorhynchus agilis]
MNMSDNEDNAYDDYNDVDFDEMDDIEMNDMDEDHESDQDEPQTNEDHRKPKDDFEVVPAKQRKVCLDELREQFKTRKIPKDQRTTMARLTKYERARLLGARALQISMSCPIMIDLDGETSPLEIAKRELKERKLPMIVRRYMPDGSYEDWLPSELDIGL